MLQVTYSITYSLSFYYLTKIATFLWKKKKAHTNIHALDEALEWRQTEVKSDSVDFSSHGNAIQLRFPDVLVFQTLREHVQLFMFYKGFHVITNNTTIKILLIAPLIRRSVPQRPDLKESVYRRSRAGHFYTSYLSPGNFHRLNTDRHFIRAERTTERAPLLTSELMWVSWL